MSQIYTEFDDKGNSRIVGAEPGSYYYLHELRHVEQVKKLPGLIFFQVQLLPVLAMAGLFGLYFNAIITNLCLKLIISYYLATEFDADVYATMRKPELIGIIRSSLYGASLIGVWII